MNKSSTIGKIHVLDINNALKLIIKGKSIKHYNDIVVRTVKYIINLYPDIKLVQSKFDMLNYNESPDLTITLKDETMVPIELFLIQGTSSSTQKFRCKSF